MHNKTVNQTFDGHFSPKKWILGFFLCLRLRDFLNIGVGEKVFFWKRCKMTWQSIIYFSITPLKCLFLRENLIFLKILKNRVYQIAKKTLKNLSHTLFFFVIYIKLVREYFGPKKITPPPLGSNVCYFCNFISIFWFSTKKIWPTLKWPKFFLHFLPSFIHNWNFSIIFKNKKVRALKVGLIGSIFG